MLINNSFQQKTKKEEIDRSTLPVQIRIDSIDFIDCTEKMRAQHGNMASPDSNPSHTAEHDDVLRWLVTGQIISKFKKNIKSTIYIIAAY